MSCRQPSVTHEKIGDFWELKSRKQKLKGLLTMKQLSGSKHS